MKLKDLLEAKQPEVVKALLESEEEEKKEPEEKSDEANSEESALEKDPEELKDDAKEKEKSEETSSDDESKESDEDDVTDEDDSFVFTLSVVDVLDQKTVFVKMGKEAAKDDDDADATIDEPEAVEQIVSAMGDKTEVTGTIDSLKEEGIDLTDILEYYEKELQEKLDAVEELESELGIQGTESDEDESIHGDLEDAGVMSGLEDHGDEDEISHDGGGYPDEYDGYHMETLDRHGVDPSAFTAKYDFNSDTMDPAFALHPEPRQSEFYEEY